MFQNQRAWLCFGILLLAITPGCLAAAAGAGAAGGYAATKYQVSGEVKGSFDKVWNTAISVLRSEGTEVAVNDRKGNVKGVVGDSQVVIKVKKKTPQYTTVRIRAWKDVLPNEKLAKRLLDKINDRS